MLCPNCYGESRIVKTLDDGKDVARIHECLDPACNSTWTTDQRLRAGSLRTRERRVRTHMPLGAVERRKPPPAEVYSPSAAPNSPGAAEGVGGGLPSGLDLRSDRSPDPHRQSDQEAPRTRVPSISTPPRRIPRVGAISLYFLRCYERYPNPFRKLQAAQTWDELAETWPGGEAALADEIGAAFDRGMLEHKPYNGEAVPKFETVLAERLWQERFPAAPATRADRNLALAEELLAEEAAR